MKKSEYKRQKFSGKILHITPQAGNKKEAKRTKEFNLIREYFEDRAENFHSNCE